MTTGPLRSSERGHERRPARTRGEGSGAAAVAAAPGRIGRVLRRNAYGSRAHYLESPYPTGARAMEPLAASKSPACARRSVLPAETLYLLRCATRLARRTTMQSPFLARRPQSEGRGAGLAAVRDDRVVPVAVLAGRFEELSVNRAGDSSAGSVRSVTPPASTCSWAGRAGDRAHATARR